MGLPFALAQFPMKLFSTDVLTIATCVTVLAACAPVSRPTSAVGAPTPWLRLSDADRSWAVVVSKQVFDSLLKAGNVEDARLVSRDGLVYVPGGDTLRGPHALQQALTQLAGGRRLIRVHLFPETVEHCTDGVFERGGEFVALLAGATPGVSDTLRGSYDARWVLQSDGVRIARMGLAAGARRRALVSWAEAGCRVAHGARFAARRWRASTFVRGIATDNLATPVQSALSARGWGDGRLRLPDGRPLVGFEGTTVDDPAWPVVAVRGLLRGPWSIGAQAAVRPAAARVQGYNAAEESHVSVDLRTWGGAVLAGYDASHWRIAAGPLVALGRTEVTHRGMATDPQPDGSVAYRAVSAPVIERAPSAVGWLVEGGYLLPATSALAVELRAQLYTSPAHVPAVGALPALRARRTGMAIGVGVHFAR